MNYPEDNLPAESAWLLLQKEMKTRVDKVNSRTPTTVYIDRPAWWFHLLHVADALDEPPK